MPLMSVRAYARHRGVSHTAVLKAIEVGRITRRKDGKIDSARADKQWEQRTDHSKPRNSVIGDPHHRRGRGEPPSPMGTTPGRRGRKKAPAAPPAKEGKGNGSGEDDGGEPLSAYAKSAGIREHYRALTAQLEYERATGDLVRIADVSDFFYESNRKAREILRTLPARGAPVVAGLTDRGEIYNLLEGLVNEVLAEISRAEGELRTLGDGK